MFISGTRQICDRVCGTAAVIVLWLCKIASIICRSVYSELRIISTGRFLLIILIGITDETSVRATVIRGMIRQIAMLGIIILNGFSASEAAYILLIYIVSTTSIT